MNPTANMLANEKNFEGNIAYMYLDSVGNVTVGVGKLLGSVNNATSLPFVFKSDGSAAAAQDITTDYNNVKAQQPNNPASYYDQFTTLKLNQSYIDAQLTSDLSAFIQQLENQFAGFDNFPAPAQEGLVDMVFNLGISNLVNGFPTFTAAVQNKDWNTAANQCHRQGISDARNDFVKNLFLAAANPNP